MAFPRVASVADEQAAEWFARRLHPADAQAEEAAFQCWLGADAAHRVAYAKTQATWARLGVAVRQPEILDLAEAAAPVRARTADDPDGSSAAGTADEAPMSSDPGASSGTRRHRWPTRSLAVAASVVLVLVGAWLVSGSLLPKNYETAVGETLTVSLADGSVVTLDTDSEIEVRYGASQREISLKRGAAFFDVTPNKSRPFVVTAVLGRTTVLGTRFEIRTKLDEMQVVLIDGSVRLEPIDANGHAQPGAIVLKPGQLATRAASRLEWRTTTADIEATTAWHTGRLIMRDMPLAQAVEEVNRYAAATRLRIGDPSLRTLTVSGVFRIGDVVSFELALENTLPVRARANGGEHLLLGREPANE
ncbi:MAG: FecR domain-containing protein [Gammaproteobacteria bacterium]